MPHAVGIDLGTTYSAVAYLDELGRSASLRNAEGDVLTPSVVLFDDAEVIVGKEAKRAAALHPDRVAECAKRDMGQPHYHRPIRGEPLPPEVIQACVLRKLRTDAEEVLGPSLATVITVPAYFDEVRRKATADAGLMAGLSVLDIVNEPTAAALAFGEHQGYLNASGEVKQPIKVLVYDLGGGTFDVTVIDLRPSDVRTLATDGDVRLGGRDWDQRLADFAAAEFQKQHGIDPRTDAAAMAALLAEVENAKHTLSVRPKAAVVVRHAGRMSEVNITREQFEELTEDLLERTAYTTRQVLAAAGLTWSDINRVLLVGGSTRMLMVAKRLEQLAGIVPDHSVHPDEAVARGAAIYAGYALRKAAGGNASSPVHPLTRSPIPAASSAGASPSPHAAHNFTVTDVTAHSLGIIGVDQQTKRRENIVLIKRNTPLPARVKQQFVTRQQGQKSIVVEVLEGESRSPEDCTAIGRAVLRDLPADLPAGWPVEVTSSLEANGRLAVSARLPGVDKQLVIELVRQHGLTGAGLERWQRVVGAAGGFGSFGSFREGAIDGGISPAIPQARPQSIPQPIAPQPLASPQPVAPPKPTPPPPPATATPIPTTQPAAPPVATDDALTDTSRWADEPLRTAVPAKSSHFDDDETEYRVQGDDSYSNDDTYSQPLPMGSSMATVSTTTSSQSGQQGKDWGAEIANRQAIAKRRFWINVAGYIGFSLLGLLIGYYILANLTPTGNFLNLPLPGLREKR